MRQYNMRTPRVHRINYSQDGNHKLRLPIHTTIRLASKAGHYKEGDAVQVFLNDVFLYEGRIMAAQEMPFWHIPIPTLWADTGYSRRAVLAIFQRMYKGFRETDHVVLMAIARTKEPADAILWSDMMAQEYNNDFIPERLTKRLKILGL